MIYKGKEIKICENKHVNDNIFIKDFDYEPINFKRKILYKCDICNEEYSVGNTIKATFRKFCRKHHFFYICDECGKEFEIIRLSDFIGSEKDDRFCSHNCALRFRNKSEEMRQIVSDMDKNRVKNNISKKQVCKNCGKKFYSIFHMNICNGCITINTNKQNSLKDQVCEKCGKVFHSPFIMKICPCCNPDIGGTPNFTIKDNVRFYKGKELTRLCEKLLYGEENILNYPGFEIRLGRVTYNRKDVLTDESILLNQDFNEKDNVLFYRNEPWNDYKEKFKIKSNNANIPKDFKLYPTFRSQDSEDWSGANNAFEQNLVDEDIGWFVYIKFYSGNDGDPIPIVCGKSGSFLVNINGSDVSFSTNIDDGPARRFLIEEKLQWDKTKVAILKCTSEQDAYDKEKYYLEKMNLFGS